MYCLECTEVPEVPHDGRWRQQGSQANKNVNSGIKGNGDIHGHCLNNVIEGAADRNGRLRSMFLAYAKT